MFDSLDLKYALRSRSLRFMKARKGAISTDVENLMWRGTPVFYRPGTSDVELIYRILLKPQKKREYQLPKGFNPKVILDIGANIGITTRLLAQTYPEAAIYAFEPLPENFELLGRNVRPFSRISAFPYGLGDQEGQVPIYASDNPANLGGFSLYEKGTDLSKRATIILKQTKSFFASLGLNHIDLIKIDTEGAEYSILTSMDPTLLAGTGFLIGELHGEKDDELVTYLSQWFDVNWQRDLGNRLSTFSAVRRT